jgi:hypothetical protein
MYDCGVELTLDGTYERSGYRERIEQGTFTLQSYYLQLWVNFGCFCMALLTQPDFYQHLCGPIMSTWQSLRNYCLSQLRSMWMFMQNNLNLTEEERCFFIMSFMTKFYEVF